jgi:hypothetical protein
MAPLPTPRRVWIARGLAVLVDFIQVALPPAEFPPLNDVIDVVTAIVMTGLVGWHWAYLPTFLAELVPFVDLVPTWTMAVFFATRGASAPPVVVVEPPRPEPDSALAPGQPPRDGSGS